MGEKELYVGLAQPKEDRQKMMQTLHQVSAEVKVGASLEKSPNEETQSEESPNEERPYEESPKLKIGSRVVLTAHHRHWGIESLASDNMVRLS